MVVVSSNMKKTIESIKEIVGNHADNDIYNALKESNMNLDAAVDILLRQGAFHEVRKRRDKKKENAENSGQVEITKPNDYVNRRPKFHPDPNARRGGSGGYTRRVAPDNLNHRVSREFRVVRDNRVNQSSARETASSTQVVEKSSHVASTNQRRPGGQYSQNLNGRSDIRPRVTEESSNIRKENLEANTPSTGSGSQVSGTKHKESLLKSGSSASSSAVGVYASASDPVHVPSLDSRSPAVGAIRREVGVVGGRRQSSESGLKQSPQQNVSNSNLVSGSSADTQSIKHTSFVSRKDQNHGTAVDSVTINSTGNRFGNHPSRFHQLPAGPKGALPTKEWKPKTNQKPSVSTPGVIGSSVKSTSQQADTSKNVESETLELQDKLTQINIHDTQKVIIAQNIRVPEFERCKFTFGSIGVESDAIEDPSPTFQEADVVEEADAVHPVEASPRSSQINALDCQVINSAPDSPSGESSESLSPDQNDSAGATSTENYVDRSFVHNSPSFTVSQSEQLQESIEVPNFSAYDPQPVYDMPYFRPSVDDTVRGTGMPSNQEALSSHSVNMAPNSSVPMMQQQTPMAQMYPPVHLSHYANVMPYRQFIPPPMYVPPPMVPGYSGNPGYPQLSNGNSYVLMPGGGSHIPSNGLKYGMQQQFKPFPASSPTGFSNLVSPSGYPMNPPGVVGGPTGLDDSSRLKYKDTNLYVPNPQGETSEGWIQNHREHPGMPSAPYFNMQGQATHPAYMQTLTGHPGFNGAAPQSSQMQFPGMYLPPPAGMPNGGHHMGNGNIGVGVAAPGPQVVGAYQQPQMNHLNWTTNF